MSTRELGAAGAAVSSAGAALVATAAGACCAPVIAPLVVTVLGASGAAWAAGLKPYSPWFLAASAGLLACGFWFAYRIPRACAPAGSAKPRSVVRAVRLTLWLTALLWSAALAVNLFIPS